MSACRLTDEGDRRGFREELLGWFSSHKRQMPWRGSTDPYAVWVSEVMLQQTQVDRVRDYFERWMERFPTVEALSEASVEEVLRLWTGLGYYRRARYLHRAAQIVVAEHEGRLPESAAALQELPGVGPYTAGAIASIAFGQAEPVVDGNVRRVLSRIDALPADLGAGEEGRRLWARAAWLVDPVRPGEFNQALMELGSLVCRVHNPGCEGCPVRSFCRAYGQGNPQDYPAPRRRSRSRPMRACSVVVYREEESGRREYLLHQRAAGGLLAGLWEFPAVEVEGRSWPDVGRLLYLFGDEEEEAHQIGEVEHLFSHRRLRMRVFAQRLDTARGLEGIEGAERWVAEQELGEVASSALLGKVLAVFLDWRGQSRLEIG